MEIGEPTDNAVIEAFNARVRSRCLNVHWFESLAEARATIEAWRIDYNELRPQSALGNLAPGSSLQPARLVRPGEALGLSLELDQSWGQTKEANDVPTTGTDFVRT